MLFPTNLLTTLAEVREGWIGEAAALRKEAERPPRGEAVRKGQTGPRGGHGWKGDTAVLGQSGSMPSVLKTTEGGASIYRERRIFYPLPMIRLIMHATDHGPACLLPGGTSVSKVRAKKCFSETEFPLSRGTLIFDQCLWPWNLTRATQITTCFK